MPKKTLMAGDLLVVVSIVLLVCAFPCNYAAGKTPAFQEEMARLLGQGQNAGPDDSGDVYHLGGLAGYYTGPGELFPGKGKYGELYGFLPLIRWYDPDYYYNTQEFRPENSLDGWYKNDQCVVCHTVENPGIVEQWRRSKHASPAEGKEAVGCDRCHGNNHAELVMPSYNSCGECHQEQLRGHRGGGQGGHAHAYSIDLCEQGSLIGKPAEEVAGCLTCHAIAENRCDGCHSRHQFSVTEARKTGSCAVCHSGPEQYEYEMYMQSYHGQIYQNEAYEWDWTQPLNAKNYKVPTCAYCHMNGGEHNVRKTSTVYTYMGTSLVDRGAPRYKEIREGWVALCKGCHSQRFARDQLEAMDEGVKLSFTKYREAMALVVDLYKEKMLDPMPVDLAPDWTGGHNLSLLPGGAVRKYNISEIERLTYELLVDMTDAIYKAKAHGAVYSPVYGYWEWAQDRWLVRIKTEASRLRRIAEIEKQLGIEHVAYDFWKHGEYTDMYLGWKMKSGR